MRMMIAGRTKLSLFGAWVVGLLACSLHCLVSMCSFLQESKAGCAGYDIDSCVPGAVQCMMLQLRLA